LKTSGVTAKLQGVDKKKLEAEITIQVAKISELE
jgi:hypothetical protein